MYNKGRVQLGPVLFLYNFLKENNKQVFTNKNESDIIKKNGGETK